MLWGATGVKAVCKYVDEIDPGSLTRGPGLDHFTKVTLP